MFFDNFESTVDKLRLALKSLKKINCTSIQKSSDFKKITADYQLKHDYFSKGSHATALSKIVEDKYSVVRDKYLCEIKDLSKEQKSVDKAIGKIFKKGKEYFELSLYEDFIPKDKFYDLVINLTKGHKVGKVDSKVLHNLKSYKEVEFEKGSVYVKDNRTQYSDIILVNDKNEILFLIRNKDDDFEPGKYCLPGGHVEANENFKAAAIRECSEETGIELKMSEVVSCGNYIDSKSNIHYFTAKFNGDPVVLQEEEQIQYEWVPIDNIAEKPLLLNLKQNLAEVVEMPKGIFNSSDKSLEGHYFDGSCIVLDDDILVQKSLDSLCLDFNTDKISVNELNDSLSKISKPFERYYIRKGNSFKCFAKLQSDPNVLEEVEVKEWDGKTYRKTDTGWKLFEEDIEKAIRSGSLIKKRRLITRGGKTFLTTVWVKPDGAIEKEETKKELPADSRISDLTVGEEVTLTTARGDKEGTVSSLVDTKEGICIVLRTPTGKATEVYLKALKKVTKKDASKTEPAPKPEPKTWSIDDFKLVKSLGGSSEVSLYEAEGTKIVLKKERDRPTGKDQLKDEALADKLYQVMGIDAPTSMVREHDGKLYKESIFIEGREYGSLTGKDKEKAKEIIRKGFVMDCLLGNWDVIGASGDNILVTGTGDSLKVYRIDNGSALRHRARGAEKPLDAFLFSTSISELSSMRDSRLNPSAASVFEGITEEEILEQSKNILSKKEDILSVITDGEIKLAIEKRLNYLNSIVTEGKEKPEDKPEEKLEKGMPSLVTQNYFSDWDSFDFVANKECKQTIKDRIIEFEKRREKNYSECAEELGISLEEYKKKLQDLTEQIFAKSSPFIAIGSRTALPLIFTEGGRFKSQFETKTSKGTMSPTSRAYTEHGFFGFDESITKDKELRPIYGYMSNNRNGVYSETGKVPPTVSHYGNVYVEINREKALKSATCTFGDSLGVEDYMTAVPFGKPHFTVLNGFRNPRNVRENIKGVEDYIKGTTNRLPGSIAGPYLELQYHNKLELSDVKTIHLFSTSNEEDLSEMSSVVNNLNKFSASVGKFIPVEIFKGR